jgi:3-oxoacyl-[acyl-carrier protein] reductase
MSEFAGRCVIVTGAGRGIGRGVAQAFAAEGAHVVLGARTLSYAAEAREAIVAAGGRAEVCALDAKDHQSCRDLVATAIQVFRRIDVIVHCAAEIAHGGLGAVSDEALEAGIASTAKAAWWLLDAARPHLAAARQGGRFIVIGSVNGTFVTVPNMTAYGMAKAALDAFVRGAAGDVVRERITVNAINPGLVASDNALRVLGAEGLAAYGATIPVGRAGTPDDIAHACFFFASQKASYCTGSTLKLDGGASVAARAEGADKVLQERLRAQHGPAPKSV